MLKKKEAILLDESIVLELVHSTSNAAKACYHWIGKGQEKDADQAAVNAMRESLNSMYINGFIAIGEGERDEAPMLYIGEKVGLGGIEVDIALDPLEGTTLCAHAANNSISVLAVTQRDGFLHALDVYMERIAVGSDLPKGVVDISNSPKSNLKNLASAKKCDVSDLVVCILNRPRHEELISKIREEGARVKLIKDGDVMAAIGTALLGSDIDMYIGIGGAPEGVLAAAALKSLNGQMQGRLICNSEAEKSRAINCGIKDFTKVYHINDMVADEAIFIATGITDGDFLEGIRYHNNAFSMNSIIITSKAIRYIDHIEIA